MTRGAGPDKRPKLDLSERTLSHLDTAAELTNMTVNTYLLVAVHDQIRADLRAAGAWTDEDEAVYQEDQPRVSPRSVDGKLRFYRKKD